MRDPSEPSALYSRLATAAAPADLSAVLARLGDQHRERGELDAAIAAYDASLALQRSGPGALGRGLVALLRGEPVAEALFREAAELLEAAGDIAGACVARGNMAVVALAAGRANEAVETLSETMGRRQSAGLPPDPFAAVNLGRALRVAGRLEEAAGAFGIAAEQARATGQGAAEGLAWLGLGDLASMGGRLDEAAAAYESAVDLLPFPSERGRARLALAGALHQMGDIGGAVRALEASLPALRSGEPEALVSQLVNLGGLRFQAQDPTGAAAALDEAAARLPSALSSSVLARRLRHNRGLALLATGRLEEGRTDLEQAAMLAREQASPADLARVLGALLDARRLVGDLTGAISVQEEILDLQRVHGVRVPEVGVVAPAVEDRSLNISTADQRRARTIRRGPALFLVPPAHGATGPLFPRGAVSVATFLEHHGVSAEVLPLAHIAPRHMGFAEAERRVSAALADALDGLRPRFVGISVPFSYLYPQGQRLAAAVRALDPDVPILMGGPHVTYQDEECLRETPAVDVVVRGEGEWTALELARALEVGADLSTVAGITWRGPADQIVKNPKRSLGDVRELPEEDFALLPTRFVETMDITALTSRGCAYRCRFCHEFRYWGGVVREHPVERITHELERLNRYGNTLQGIDDSMLDMRTPFFHSLVEALGRSPHLSPNFGLLTRLDTITAEGAEAMRRAGMRWVCVGVESGSQRVLDTMNKEIRVEQIRRGLELARGSGLSASGFLIVGHPGDDEQESAITRDFVDRLFQDELIHWLDLSTFSPYPGTPYYNQPERHGIEILVRDWNLWRRTNRPVAQLVNYPAEAIYLNLLRLLAVQDAHVRGRIGPPALGSGAGAT